MEANNMAAMREVLADTAENLRIHLQIPTQTISMNRLEVEAMARDCEKALSEDGHGEAKDQPATVGNAAKLREAVEYASRVLAKWRRDAPFSAWNEYGEAIDKCRAALSAPPRNCDVGTAEEQAKRFDAFCGGKNCQECPHFPDSRCELAWAQMQYEAEKGDAKWSKK